MVPAFFRFPVKVKLMAGCLPEPCEKSVLVVGKAVRSYQSNRFFTPFHRSVSRPSHKVFLPPFRMTLNRRHSWDSNHFQACR